VPLFPLISEGHHVVGSCAFADETYRESVAHLAGGHVPVERLVSERVSLDDTPDALRRLQAPGSLVRIIARPSA
jgi:threonine dehydrogenase-like Zn-dependent dehydrogenase